MPLNQDAPPKHHPTLPEFLPFPSPSSSSACDHQPRFSLAAIVATAFATTVAYHVLVSSRTFARSNSTSTRISLPELTPPSPPQFSAASHDVCLVIGYDPAVPHSLWRFNSRSICLTSPLCLPTPARGETPSQAASPLHSSNFSLTTCRAVTLSFQPMLALGEAPLPDFDTALQPHFASCADLHARAALCPLKPPPDAYNACLPLQPATPTELDSTFDSANIVLDGITLIVPRFPYTESIFHFANVATTIHAALTHVDALVGHYGAHKLRPPPRNAHVREEGGQHPFNILFLVHKPPRGIWQHDLLEILLRGRASRVLRQDLNIAYHGMQREYASGAGAAICVRNPIVLGRRGGVNIWPFANGSAVPTDGSAVPRHALDFRQDVYSALEVTPRAYVRAVGGAGDIVGKAGEIVVLPLPRRVVGYARRAGMSASVGGSVHKGGTRRQFGAADEEWFATMLDEEARGVGYELSVFTVQSNHTLEAQVQMYEGVGVLTGIHGANLVNAMFTRPLAALVEIFPALTGNTCYVAGGNAGLAYWSYTAKEQASREESGCSREETMRCINRNRVVKIGTPTDRDTIRRHVREAIAYIERLYRDFPSGVPAMYDPDSSVYRVVYE